MQQASFVPRAYRTGDNVPLHDPRGGSLRTGGQELVLCFPLGKYPQTALSASTSCTCTHKHVYICTRVHTRVYTPCTHACTPTHHIHMHTCMRTHSHLYKHLRVCTHAPCPLGDKGTACDTQRWTDVGLQCAWRCLPASCLARRVLTVGSMSPVPRRDLEEMVLCAQRLQGKGPYRCTAHCVWPGCVQSGGAEEGRHREGGEWGATAVWVATEVDNKSQGKNRARAKAPSCGAWVGGPSGRGISWKGNNS